MTAGIGWTAALLTQAINTSRFGSFVALAICVPLGALIYLAVALLLRAPEAQAVLARLHRRARQ